MVINGAPASNEQIRVEGQTSGDTSGLRLYTAIGQAGAEAIQEVAVQTSNFAAEYGAVGGGIFNMTMKSGTNQLHGSAYDYAANDVLNASQPYTGVKTPTKRHDYGFSAGGPIWIPKLYDGRNKSFVFMSFEEFRENALVTSIPAGNPTVPTDAYRNGNFTQVITGNGNAAGPLPFQINGKTYIDPLGNSYPSGTIFDPEQHPDRHLRRPSERGHPQLQYRLHLRRAHAVRSKQRDSFVVVRPRVAENTQPGS